jgi:hypothetical protein
MGVHASEYYLHISVIRTCKLQKSLFASVNAGSGLKYAKSRMRVITAQAYSLYLIYSFTYIPFRNVKYLDNFMF